jgi:hypothetical protein
LRSDNRGEYTSNEFRYLYKEARIKRELTMPFNPQHNGVDRSPHRILENKTPEEAFTRVRLEIRHLRIFLYPVYIHVPKDKRTKLEPSGRKGMFVGYSKASKAYRIYIPGQRHVEIGQDVKLEEDLAFRRSQETTTGGEEQEDPKVEESTDPSSTAKQPSDHEEESEELVDPVDPLSDKDTRPRWHRDTLKDVEGHETPKGTFMESRPP